MSPEESLAIVRIAKGAFPATTMDEFTPDAWALALEDDRFIDAQEAIKLLMREQTFIHVSDIAKRITAIRNDRIREFGLPPIPPPELADDPEAEMRWRADALRRIADGEHFERLEVEASADHTARRDAILTSKPLPVIPEEDLPGPQNGAQRTDRPTP